MILTIIIFVIVLGLLVFVHELGHFLVAKKSGMQVDEFGFGFPPRVIGVYRTNNKGAQFVFGSKTPPDAQGTIYSLNLIPLGGFVKIVGENNDAPNNPNSFGKKPFWMRLCTLLAGVVMNAVLAWVLISIGLAVGIPTVIDEQNVTALPQGATLSAPLLTILDVREQSPASKAGILVGDKILAIDRTPVDSKPVQEQIVSVQNYIKERKGQNFEFLVSRSGETETLVVTSNANPGPGEGPTGVSLGMVGNLRYPWYRAPLTGLRVASEQLYAVVGGLAKLVSGGVSLNQVGGPVKIAQLTGEASRLGIIYLLQFAAFLSLNLAVLNSLPIPALDGGRVLFLIIEKIRRKPNNPNIEQAVNAFGFLALLLLMLIVTINDFNGFSAMGRLFGK